MSKHTPGPWKVTHQVSTDFSWDIVRPGQGNHQAFPVATCGACRSKDSPQAANAALIAAAPDLLAFARKWVDFRNGVLEPDGSDIDPKELWYMATQAIAKADKP